MGSTGSKVGPEEEKSKKAAQEREKRAEEFVKEYIEPNKILPTSVPRDADGYVQSFSLGHDEDILKFFDEYGFVVINNVINDEQADKTVDEVCTRCI